MLAGGGGNSEGRAECRPFQPQWRERVPASRGDLRVCLETGVDSVGRLVYSCGL